MSSSFLHCSLTSFLNAIQKAESRLQPPSNTLRRVCLADMAHNRKLECTSDPEKVATGTTHNSTECTDTSDLQPRKSGCQNEIDDKPKARVPRFARNNMLTIQAQLENQDASEKSVAKTAPDPLPLPPGAWQSHLRRAWRGKELLLPSWGLNFTFVSVLGSRLACVKRAV